MTKQEAIDELLKDYVPEYVNYIVTALTDGATPSDAPTINAIPIPEDATNGDVIKAMFPSIHMIEVFPKVHLFINNCMVARIDINMWNAPYKYRKEQTDESKI